MRLSRSRSLLLVIDVQSRLLPAIDQHAERLQHIHWLMQVAARLGVPMLATEHYPARIGHSEPSIRSALAHTAVMEKTHFSAVSDGLIDFHPAGAREQWVVVGTEAHVCVLQTALDLLDHGKQVYVVAEAVGSRRDTDRQVALERLRQSGAVIVSREMVAFEWLENGEAPEFREILREFLR